MPNNGRSYGRYVKQLTTGFDWVEVYETVIDWLHLCYRVINVTGLTPHIFMEP